MVACPHDQDRGKTRHEREVRRPLLEQRTTQGGHGNRARRQMWHLQIEHQQRHGDGKDAVAERFQATGLFFDGPCSQFTAHCLSPSRHDRPLLPGGGSVSTCTAERCLPTHKQGVPLLKARSLWRTSPLCEVSCIKKRQRVRDCSLAPYDDSSCVRLSSFVAASASPLPTASQEHLYGERTRER